MSTSSSAAEPAPTPAERVVVVATGNVGKLVEIRSAMPFPGWRFVAASELGPWEPPEETGQTFAENALIKARYAAETFGHAALADDSGLEVDALDGEPGVYSSRYAGPCADDAENNRRLLLAMKDVPEAERTARFRCFVAFVSEDRSEVLADGACDGTIGVEPRGSGGFRLRPVILAACDGGTDDGRARPRREERDQSPRGCASRPR